MSTSNVITNASKILFIDWDSFPFALLKEPMEFLKKRPYGVFNERADGFDGVNHLRIPTLCNAP